MRIAHAGIWNGSARQTSGEVIVEIRGRGVGVHHLSSRKQTPA